MAKTAPQPIGQMLWDAREERQLSRLRVYRDTGISPSTLSKIEKASIQGPRWRDVVLLARLYDLDLESLAEETVGELEGVA